MPKLMVPIDGSESAMHALDHAIALAKERGGLELSLINVHPDPIVYGEIQVYRSRPWTRPRPSPGAPTRSSARGS